MSVVRNTLLLTGDDGYQISRSVRLRSSASAYFNRTFGTPTSGNIFTWSGWVKRGAIGAVQPIFNPSLAGGEGASFNSSNQLVVAVNGAFLLVSTPVYRDPSAWYHIMLVSDMGNATAALRFRVYVNGVEVTAWATDARASYTSFPYWNKNAVVHYMGYSNAYPAYADGYMTEVNFIDGQALTPSSFGETDVLTGVWKPKKYLGTYGTNGFFLKFDDPSAATAAAIGKDNSGNGNNWTPNNISVTSGVTYDSMIDSPTMYADGGNGLGNYCVINPLDTQNASSVAQGNQYISFSAVNYGHSRATQPAPDGSYWEVVANGSAYLTLGVANSTAFSSFNWAGCWAIYQSDGKVYNNAAAITGVLATFTTNDVIGFAVKGGKLYIAKNGTWLNSGDPVAQTGYVASGMSSELFPYIGNGGGAAGTPSAYANFGQRPFTYTPPTGFKALNTQNLPAGSITTSGSFTGNASADGPFVYLNGVPTAMTINGNAVTFATHVDKTANGFKLRTSSSSYNASGSNTYSITTTGAKFKYANAQGNP